MTSSRGAADVAVAAGSAAAAPAAAPAGAVNASIPFLRSAQPIASNHPADDQEWDLRQSWNEGEAEDRAAGHQRRLLLAQDLGGDSE